MRARFIISISALSVAYALALYLPTFGLSWAYDDVDYINLGARMLAGELGVWTTLFHPHSEHLVAGFQALFFAYLHFVGIDATAWRVGAAVVHALSAIFLALLARRYGRSARAGVAAAIVYIGTCGFASMWVWFPSAATVPLMMALLTGASLLLTWRDRLALRRVLAGTAVVLALVTESAFAPIALLPAVIDEYERRREGRRGLGLLSCWTLTMIAVCAAIMASLRDANVSVDLARGIPRAAFLVLAAPFRFFVPGVAITSSSETRFAILVALFGVTIAATVAALLVALWRRGVPSLAVLSALTLPASLGVIGLIGLGRWRVSYPTLYETDRYFFPLLVPAALLAAAIADSISLDGWPRLSRALLLATLSVAVAGELALQRRAMFAAIPTVVFKSHEARFASLARLATMLDRAGPIEIPNQVVWFPGLHNGRLYTPVLTEVLCHRCQRLRLGGATVDAATAARLNIVLDRWAQDSGEPLPYLRVVDGRMVNTRVQWRIDFAPSRWMGARGEVTLTVAQSDLRITLAAPHPLTLRATLVDVGSGLAFPLGSAKITGGAVQTIAFPVTPLTSTLGGGRTARLVLESDCTSQQCVQLFAAGSDGDR